MFTIGADPELFFRNNEKLISVIDKLGGTKEEPMPIAVQRCTIQEDNVAAEYNIPPCTTVEDFIWYNQAVLYDLTKRAQAMGLHLAANVASHSFDDSELMHWKAGVFGCEPDLNAWTHKTNPRPRSKDPNLRSAGGHVHIGSSADPFQLGRACDVFLGVPALQYDHDKLRRSLYGKAGAIRIKSYGVEYRTLSNFWIWDETHIRWVYAQTKKATEFVEKGNVIPDYLQGAVEAAINKNDKTAFDFVMEYANDLI